MSLENILDTMVDTYATEDILKKDDENEKQITVAEHINSLPEEERLRGDYDYDTYSKEKEGELSKPYISGQHFTSKYKRPNHPTFSDESIYHNDKQKGGQWYQYNGKWYFQPSEYNLTQYSKEELQKYFKEREKDAVLVLPEEKKQINPNLVTLAHEKTSERTEEPSKSTTTTKNLYRDNIPFDDYIKQRGYKNFDEFLGAYAHKPSEEELRKKQNRQHWIALAKSGAAGITQLLDIIYSRRGKDGTRTGSSVGLKDYDLGTENLQEAKKEQAIYDAKMQEYFNKAAEVEKALQKDYFDYLKTPIGKVSTTENERKKTTTTESGTSDQQKTKGTTINNKIGEIETGPFSFTDRGISKKIIWSYEKGSKALESTYSVLDRNKEDLQSIIGIDKKIFTKGNTKRQSETKDHQFDTIEKCISALYTHLHQAYDEKITSKIDFIEKILNDIKNSGLRLEVVE